MWDFSKLPESRYQEVRDLYDKQDWHTLKKILMDLFKVFKGECTNCFHEQVKSHLNVQISAGLLKP